MGSLFGGAPSQAKIQAQQEAAAERERLKIEQETAANAAKDRVAGTKAAVDAESKRRAFSGALTEAGDEKERKRFLAGA